MDWGEDSVLLEEGLKGLRIRGVRVRMPALTP